MSNLSGKCFLFLLVSRLSIDLCLLQRTMRCYVGTWANNKIIGQHQWIDQASSRPTKRRTDTGPDRQTSIAIVIKTLLYGCRKFLSLSACPVLSHIHRCYYRMRQDKTSFCNCTRKWLNSTQWYFHVERFLWIVLRLDWYCDNLSCIYLVWYFINRLKNPFEKKTSIYWKIRFTSMLSFGKLCEMK